MATNQEKYVTTLVNLKLTSLRGLPVSASKESCASSKTFFSSNLTQADVVARPAGEC
jgi:hypothetical protein